MCRHAWMIVLALGALGLLAVLAPDQAVSPVLAASDQTAALNARLKQALDDYRSDGAICNEIRALLAQGADVKLQGSLEGRTPLIVGALWGDAQLVDQALRLGAPADQVDTFGLTPLFWAVFHGQEKIARSLLGRGAWVNAARQNGDSPLSYAAATKYAGSVRLLLEHGADVNHRGNGGMTPLAEAAERGTPETVRLLLRYGARARVWDMENLRPLDRARRRDDPAVVALLEAAERSEIRRSGRRRGTRRR